MSEQEQKEKNAVELEGPLFSAPSLPAGLNVGVHGKITNRGQNKLRVELSFSASSQCDDKVYVFGGGTCQLVADQALFFSTVWAIPPEACAGQYVISIQAAAHNEELATVAGELTVTAAAPRHYS